MNSRSWPRETRRFAVVLVVLAGGWLLLGGACDPEAPYTRLPAGGGGEVGSGGQGESPGTGGAVTPGTGGVIGTGGSVVSSGGIVGAPGGAAGGHGGVAAGGAGGRLTGSGGAGGQTPGSGGAGNTGGKGGSPPATGGAGGGGHGGGAGGSSAQKIVSIDFVGGVVANGAITSTMPMAATEMAGVKPATHWNEAAGAASTAALTPLVQADGTNLTGSSVTWTTTTTSTSIGVYWAGLTDAAGDTRMMNGYLDPAAGTGATATATITVSGLSALTGGYDVYVYFMAQLASGKTRTHKLAIGSTSVTVSQSGPSPTTFPGYTKATDGGTTGNYVLFKNVTGASFVLTSTPVTTNDNALRAPVNGLQIVWPSGS